MNTDFRFVLKAGAQERHDGVDALFSRLDLHQYDDYVRFLSLQAQCFAILLTYADEQCLTQDILNRMCGALATDLHALGQPLPAGREPELHWPRQPDPLAIDYVVAGSRLGARVLAQRHARSGDERVLSARAYLGLPHDPALWRAVCSTLSEIDPDSPRAACVLADVCAIFDLFAAIGRDQMTGHAQGVFAQ